MSSQKPLQPSTTVGHVTWGPESGYKTWYRVTGSIAESKLPPLIILHGGPGFTHDILLRLADITALTGRPVIHYDQIGNGNSTHFRDRKGDSDFWTIGLFTEELHKLITHLDLKECYLLGHSWGGILAQEFVYTNPTGLKGVVISNSLASIPDFVVGCDRLLRELPSGVLATLEKHEEAGTLEDPEYEQALNVFYGRHCCRLPPNEWPQEVFVSLGALADDPTVYHTMNGPSEFRVIGSNKDWSFIDRLPSITGPVLILSGKYDECVPELQESLKAGLVNAKVEWTVFEESSHTPYLEEYEKFMKVLGDWLAKHD